MKVLSVNIRNFIRALGLRNIRFLGLRFLVLGLGLSILGSFQMGCSDRLITMASIEAMADGEPITPKITKALRKDFKKKLKKEVTEFSKKQKSANREASQERKTLFKQWNQQEKKARHAFFEANLKGADRRAYVKDFILRRDQMLAQNKLEAKALKDQHIHEMAEFKKGQDERLRLFEESLSKNLMPPKTLWGEEPLAN